MVLNFSNNLNRFADLVNLFLSSGEFVTKSFIRVKGASLPTELKIVKDMRPGHEGHYMIAPAKNMTLKKYLGILEELGLDRSRVKLVAKEELANAS